MVTITKAARQDWAARINSQAKQMLMIAAAASNDGMRTDLLEFASRLEAHADQISAAAQAPIGTRAAIRPLCNAKCVPLALCP